MGSVSANYLSELIDRMAAKPIHEIMRDDERERGHRIVVPGEVAWLPADDWHHTVVVSIAGDKVRLIAILANRPGTGAFRRLVSAINEAGLMPVVIAPSYEMRATLKRWGWKGRTSGYGLDSEERWAPRRNSKPPSPSNE